MVEQERIIAVSEKSVERFNEKADELRAKGYGMLHNFQVTAIPSDIHHIAYYSATFTEYPSAAEAVQDIDYEKERLTPTPYDDEISVAQIYLDEGANMKPDDPGKRYSMSPMSVRADTLMNLLGKRQEWRYAMRENPDITG